LIQLALNVIQSALPEDEQLDIQVVVIPCVGDQSYARRQMLALTSQMTNSSSAIVESTVPDILPPSPLVLSRDDYFQFGEPHVEILNTFRKMQQEHDIVLDLLYGAPAWTILLRHLRVDHESGTDRCSMLDGRSIMYVHSGGMEGINTQLLRYKHKKLVKMDEIQLPKL
jgi:1-aminocyclopropane-1-carboxylate deaminase/D-cysteine desulfhydrase-like pyridoxal-dependent ACC family enzyme